MHKQVWFTGIILSVIFVSFGIATWGALEKQDRVVTIAGGVIALVTLVTGLLQHDAVRKSLLALLSPSSSSPPQRERLVILVH